jgi:hypothetical protein
MIVAAVLIALGETPERALVSVEAAKGLPIPDTPEQAQWVAQYATLRQERP